MPLIAVPESSCLRLRDLRITDQLFLWTLRHVVCAAEDGLAIKPVIEQFYQDAGVPRVIPCTVALLRTLSASATGSLTVNVPCGMEVLADERALLNDLHANAMQADDLVDLAAHVRPTTAPSVAARLHDLAREFAALDSMRGAARRPALASVH